MANGMLLEKAKKLVKFEDVRQEVARIYDQNMSDLVVNLSEIRMIKADVPTIEVPQRGRLELSNWSRSQMSSLLGIQWCRWFDKMEPYVIQEEIQRRLKARSNDSVKLRMRRWGKDNPKGRTSTGYLRAMLGPRYEPIDDERIFTFLENRKPEMAQMAFVKNHMNRGGSWSHDHGSYYTMVSTEPVDMGPFNRSAIPTEIKDLKIDTDWVYQGLQIVNSEVGYTAVKICEFSLRLVCTNGAIMLQQGRPMLYQQHRPIKDLDLSEKLRKVFVDAPHRWKTSATNMRLLTEIPVTNPESTINNYLADHEVKLETVERVRTAYKLEPLSTMYGIFQAITRAARDLNSEEEMDERYALESVGGELVSNVAKARAWSVQPS